jgi:ribose 5-phosphate isomerase B
MKVGISNDHRAVKIKPKIIKYLKSKSYEVIDFGPNTDEPTDYPIYAFQLGQKISNNEIDFGILLCGTGVGMCIAANKVKGVRCANVNNIKDTKLTREHNNANMIALSADSPLFKIKDILDVFLKTKFSNEERHNRRISLISSYENYEEIKTPLMNKEEIPAENNIDESSTTMADIMAD